MTILFEGLMCIVKGSFRRMRMQKGEKVLVTGATGFLGKYLVRQLLEQGYKVYALGRNKEAGAELEEEGAIFCEGDFTDKYACARFFKGMDYVIHAGALSTVWGKWEDFQNTNVIGTRNVCALCRKFGIKRMVYISSPSIYSGKKDRYKIKEKDYNPKNQLNYYIRSKILAEKIIRKYHENDLYTVTIRPRGLIGVGDTSLIPRILKANDKIGIPLFNEGKNFVDVTCVENVAHACLLALEAKDISGEVFNITNGEPMQFKEILLMFLDSIHKKPHYLKLPFHLVYGIASLLEAVYRRFGLKGEPALTKYTVCTLAFSQTLDISKAKIKLGYRPIISLEEGIKNYGKWWLENN